MDDNTISVEVAYATPEKQRIVTVKLAANTTVYDAVLQSGIHVIFPEIDLLSAKMGIFGKVVQPETQGLVEGDRIEIYRPLKIDPKASRKARADKAKAARRKSASQ